LSPPHDLAIPALDLSIDCQSFALVEEQAIFDVIRRLEVQTQGSGATRHTSPESSLVPVPSESEPMLEDHDLSAILPIVDSSLLTTNSLLRMLRIMQSKDKQSLALANAMSPLVSLAVPHLYLWKSASYWIAPRLVHVRSSDESALIASRIGQAVVMAREIATATKSMSPETKHLLNKGCNKSFGSANTIDEVSMTTIGACVACLESVSDATAAAFATEMQTHDQGSPAFRDLAKSAWAVADICRIAGADAFALKSAISPRRVSRA